MQPQKPSLIDSVAENAAALYRAGMKMPDAVRASLDQFKIKDPREREPIYRAACKILASRGGKVAGRRSKVAAAKRRLEQGAVPKSKPASKPKKVAHQKAAPAKTVTKVVERLLPVNGEQLRLQVVPTGAKHPGLAYTADRRRQRFGMHSRRRATS